MVLNIRPAKGFPPNAQSFNPVRGFFSMQPSNYFALIDGKIGRVSADVSDGRWTYGIDLVRAD